MSVYGPATMAPKYEWIRVCGVAGAVLCGGGSTGARGFQDNPPGAEAPPVELAKPTVLLLHNGHVFQGEILEDATGYYLKHKIGVKQFARRNVAGVFASLDAAYQFQSSRVPKGDPDEHMRLALWCLEHDLRLQAKQQLESVLAFSDNPRARAMLFQLDSKPAGSLDPNVVVTGAEVPPDAAAGMPRELNQRVLDRLRTERSPGGPPRVLDLPAALAVKRFQDFARYVHAPLQVHCARCHDVENPNYTGSFRLVRTRSARDNQNDMVLRTNLDATLELVDPDDLGHSKLLSAAAMTHPPDGRPVLGGPNHPAYRAMLTWVTSLKDPGSPNAIPTEGGERRASTGVSESAGESDGGFATGRGGVRPQRATGPASAPDSFAGAPVTAPAAMRQGMVGSRDAAAPGIPNTVDFPDPRVPPPQTLPKLPSPSARPDAPASVDASKPATTAGPASNLVEMEDGSTGIRLPNGEVVPYVSAKDRDKPGASKKKADDTKRPPAKAKTGAPPAIDTKALDQFLGGKNS